MARAAVGRHAGSGFVRRLPGFDYSGEYLAGYELRFYPVCPGWNCSGIFRFRSVVFADASDSGPGAFAAVVPDCPRQEEIKGSLLRE